MIAYEKGYDFAPVPPLSREKASQMQETDRKAYLARWKRQREDWVGLRRWAVLPIIGKLMPEPLAYYDDGIAYCDAFIEALS